MKRLEDKIYVVLAKERTPKTSEEIAATFMGVVGNIKSASRVLDKVLGNDPRFIQTPKGWLVKNKKEKIVSLERTPWIVISGSTVTHRNKTIPIFSIGKTANPATEAVSNIVYVEGITDFAKQIASETTKRWGLRAQPIDRSTILSTFEKDFQQKGIFCNGLFSRGIGALLQTLDYWGSELPEHIFPLPDICQLIMGINKRPSPDEIYKFFSMERGGDEPFFTSVLITEQLIPLIVEELASMEINTVEALSEKLASLYPPISFDKYDFGLKNLDTIPEMPGVYFFYDSSGNIIYIGKSKNLKHRVKSYFRYMARGNKKLEEIQKKVYRFSYRSTGSDLEALLEEALLIKRHSPPINVQVQIHGSSWSKPLTEPIVAILPATEPSKVQLFFLAPPKTICSISIEKSSPDIGNIEKVLVAISLNKKLPLYTSKYPSELFPLALRWLRRNFHSYPILKINDFPNTIHVLNAIYKSFQDIS